MNFPHFRTIGHGAYVPKVRALLILALSDYKYKTLRATDFPEMPFTSKCDLNFISSESSHI